jgi:short subunit dehydrogenase-like uncharacterized protein
MREIWMLGAAGRSGRAVAAHLAAQGASLVLVGRDRASLEAVAKAIGGTARIVTVASFDAIITALKSAGPVVVANFIGPFAQTALPVIRAGIPDSHYLDLCNEFSGTVDVLALHDEAVAAQRCLVSGAGWGVLGSEGLVLHLCKDKPSALRARVDVAPFVDAPGLLGATLAATIIDAIPEGNFIFRNGAKVATGFGSNHQTLTTPDGTVIAAGAVSTGDLEAARRASGAPNVIAASSMAPDSALVRGLVPVMGRLLAWRAFGDFAKRRLAKVVMPPAKEKKPSWSHARIEWADGQIAEGWLRAGDASDFTAATSAEVALRLARGEGRPGAYTPGALFGSELAVLAGGTFLPG